MNTMPDQPIDRDPRPTQAEADAFVERFVYELGTPRRQAKVRDNLPPVEHNTD